MGNRLMYRVVFHKKAKKQILNIDKSRGLQQNAYLLILLQPLLFYIYTCSAISSANVPPAVKIPQLCPTYAYSVDFAIDLWYNKRIFRRLPGQ